MQQPHTARNTFDGNTLKKKTIKDAIFPAVSRLYEHFGFARMFFACLV